jgi:hypothetical protein
MMEYVLLHELRGLQWYLHHKSISGLEADFNDWKEQNCSLCVHDFWLKIVAEFVKLKDDHVMATQAQCTIRRGWHPYCAGDKVQCQQHEIAPKQI